MGYTVILTVIFHLGPSDRRSKPYLDMDLPILDVHCNADSWDHLSELGSYNLPESPADLDRYGDLSPTNLYRITHVGCVIKMDRQGGCILIR